MKPPAAQTPVEGRTDHAGRAHLLSPKETPENIIRAASGPAFDRYRDDWRAAGEFERRPNWPLHLDVDANYACNLACVMCPMGAPGFPAAYSQKLLDFDLYARVMAEGAARGLASVRIGITGEPLLRPDAIDFVRLARDLGLLDIMLITNGLLLDEKTIRGLLDSGLTRLMVSLDAFRPETYRRIRRGGDLTRVLKNIDRFLELRAGKKTGLPLLRVSFVRMSLNVHELEDFKAFWRDRADYISVQEYANILEKPETNYFTDQRPQKKDFRCPDPWQRMSLFVNGDLFPCCSDFARLAPLGRAGRTPVRDVWLSPEAERLRQLHREGRFSEIPICRRCALASTAVEG